MATEPPVQYNDDIREMLRERGEPVPLELALTYRPSSDDVRFGLPRVAWESYDELPTIAKGWYLPDEHALIIDLPERDHATLDESIDDSG